MNEFDPDPHPHDPFLAPSGESRYWTMDLTDMNRSDLLRSIADDKMVALVDENEGGIIAYVIYPFARGIVDGLNADNDFYCSECMQYHPRSQECQ